MSIHDFDKLFEGVDMSGIAWTAANENPLVIDYAGKTFRCWPHHHATSGTTRWTVEVDGTRRSGWGATPDDTEVNVRRELAPWWATRQQS